MLSNNSIINLTKFGAGGKKVFKIKKRFFPPAINSVFKFYSTVTDLAKFLGLSTSNPFSFEI